MKDRFNRAKQYVLSHKMTVVGAGAGITLGWKVGSMMQHKHTLLSITPDELQTLLDDATLSARYDLAKRTTIHLVQTPSR